MFGLTTPEVQQLKSSGYYPRGYYESNPELKGVIDSLASGFFSKGDTELFKPIVDNLLYDDPYLLLADYASYIESQDAVSRTYKDIEAWSRMSILNVARMGKFSSDRSISEYAKDIWKVDAVPVEVKDDQFETDHLQ